MQIPAFDAFPPSTERLERVKGAKVFFYPPEKHSPANLHQAGRLSCRGKTRTTPQGDMTLAQLSSREGVKEINEDVCLFCHPVCWSVLKGLWRMPLISINLSE